MPSHPATRTPPGPASRPCRRRARASCASTASRRPITTPMSAPSAPGMGVGRRRPQGRVGGRRRHGDDVPGRCGGGAADRRDDRGLLAVADIAASGAVRLLMGIADYLADLGVASSREVLAFPRSCLVVAPPLGVCPAGRRSDARLRRPVDHRGRGVRGQGPRIGRQAVHPSQPAGARQPGVHAVGGRDHVGPRCDRAAAGEAGAFALDGAMIDEPVLRRPRES